MIRRPKDDGGFWRLGHDDLRALLARKDLSWETARVYLALGDLTCGYGYESAIVSLGHLAAIVHIDRPHVARALKVLTEMGLAGQGAGPGQKVTRWIVWPPPVAKAGNSTDGQAVAKAGNTSPVAKGVAEAGNPYKTTKNSATAAPLLRSRSQESEGVAEAGNSLNQTQKSAAAKPPPDPRVSAFLGFFSQAFKAARGQVYLVTGGKDGATVKRLLRTLDGKSPCALAELKLAAARMLGDKWGGPRATIGLLSSQLNTWRGNGRPKSSASIGGAKYGRGF